MKNKKISIFLSGVMILSSLTSVQAYEKDIDSHWSREAFLRLDDLNIMNGYDDGSYHPDEKITRAEFFAVVNRVCNASRNQGSEFSDVNTSAWYKNIVDVAYTSNYASGYDDGTFCPEAFITRAEAAAVIVKAFGGDNVEASDFTDAESIPDWAKEYIDILTSGGYLSGYDDGTFRAQEYITRAETAALFDRFIGQMYYSSEDVSEETFTENLIIGDTDIIFKNTVFEGDIYIGAGVFGGEIRFVDCEIKGTVYMSGRSNATVVFENTDCRKVCVNSTDSTALISTGSSVIEETVIRSQCRVRELNSDKGIEHLKIYAEAELEGSFGEVTILDGSGITLSEGEIKTLIVIANTNPQITVNGTILNVEAKKSCSINDILYQAGSSKNNVTSGNDDDTEYSYTLSRLNNNDFESDSLVGGTRTDVITDKAYLLENLTISSGTLTPSFSPEITEYLLTVPNEVGTITIVPTADELSECRAYGKTIKSGYTADNFADSTQTVNIDIYNGLVKRNTYIIRITGYSMDNTEINNISVDLPHNVVTNSDKTAYTIGLMGDIDYSSGKIPVTLNAETLNPGSQVTINGISGKSFEFDMYDEKMQTFNVVVTSQSGNAAKTYTVTVERPHISQIDDPNSEVIDRIISNPDSFTADDIKKAKLYNFNEDKLTEYINYIKTTAYHANGVDTKGKQTLIQNAVDIVNKWSGRTLRIELEKYCSYTPNIKALADDSTQFVCSGIGSNAIVIGNSGELDGIPEGNYSMVIRWADRNVNGPYSVSVNDVQIFSGRTAKTWKGALWNNGELKTTDLEITELGSGTFAERNNKISILAPGNTAIFDYIEIRFNF